MHIYTAYLQTSIPVYYNIPRDMGSLKKTFEYIFQRISRHMCILLEEFKNLKRANKTIHSTELFSETSSRYFFPADVDTDNANAKAVYFDFFFLLKTT